MEAFKSWALSVMAATAITAIISFISPTGVLDKSIKIVTALFMMLCFLLPITEKEFTADFSSGVENISEWLADNELKQEVEGEVESVLENAIVSEISAYLTNNGVDNYDVKADVSVDESNNISIEKIVIRIFEETEVSALTEFVEGNFGVAPDITVSAEG